jgi:hypothetical protein
MGGAQLSIAVLAAAAWALRPASRRLPGATIRGLADAAELASELWTFGQ